MLEQREGDPWLGHTGEVGDAGVDGNVQIAAEGTEGAGTGSLHMGPVTRR